MRIIRHLIVLMIVVFSVNPILFAQSGAWVKRNDYGGGVRYGSTSFSIGDKGYVVAGQDSFALKRDVWEFDPTSGVWTQKADFPDYRISAVGFSINGKGYVGTGFDGTYYRYDFWEYDTAFNVWMPKADFPGSGRMYAAGFSMDGKGYIGTGSNNYSCEKDFWQYDPTIDSWIQIADFGGGFRRSAVGFSIENNGYVGKGESTLSGTSVNDFWEYNPTINQWIQKANPSGYHANVAGFSIGDKGYICLGEGNFTLSEYDKKANKWINKAGIPGSTNTIINAFAFAIGDKGYYGTGKLFNGTVKKDFWEFNPVSVRIEKLSASSISLDDSLWLYYTIADGKKGMFLNIQLSDSLGVFTYTKQLAARTDSAGYDSIHFKIPYVYAYCGRKYCIRIVNNSGDSSNVSDTFEIATGKGLTVTGNDHVKVNSTETYRVNYSKGFNTYTAWRGEKSDGLTMADYKTYNIAWGDKRGESYIAFKQQGAPNCLADSVYKQIFISNVRDTLEISKDTIFLESAIDSQTVNITSNVDWGIQDSIGWLSVDKYTGSNHSIIKIRAQENLTYVQRTHVYSIVSDSFTRQLVVIQKGKILQQDTLELSNDTLYFTAEADSQTVNIISNVNWKIQDSVSWLTLDKYTGSNHSTIKIEVQENMTYVQRTHIYSVVSDSFTRTLVVIQEGKIRPPDTLELSNDTLYFTSAGDSQTVNLTSNTSWTIGSTDPWLMVNPVSGTSDTVLTIYVSANGASLRRTTAIIASTDSLTKTIVIIQDASVGLKKVNVGSILILYPNPTNGLLSIQGLKGKAVIKDILGTEFMTIDIDGAVDLSSYPSGIYFIQSGTNTYKIVKY